MLANFAPSASKTPQLGDRAGAKGGTGKAAYGPKRWRNSAELMNAFTISDLM